MEESDTIMTLVKCPEPVVAETLDILRASGRLGHEGIVLWLGRRSRESVDIIQAYEPEHEAQRDMFYIPPGAMKRLQGYLRENRLMIGSQVHSHPGAAFHSRADDTWAIVRHVGALSIVAPNFAANITATTFLSACATFQLSEGNRWLEISPWILRERCVII